MAKRIFTFLLSFTLVLGCLPLMTSAADLTGVQVVGTYSTGTNLQGTGTHHAAYPKMAFTSTVSGSQDSTVTVNPATVFQQFDGIGFSLEETSIHNLWQLSKERREQLLTTIVKDMKIDVFRMVIGCCDCNYRYPFWSNDSRSYAKTSEGQYDLDVEDDFDLNYFSIQMDHDLHVVETVQFIRSLNPNVKFFASAWSPPSWMKEIRYMKQGTNKYCDFELNEDGSYKVMLNANGTPVRRYKGWIAQNTYTMPNGASNTRSEQMNYLRDDCIDALADYYLRYVLAYKELGIDLYAITILNEPGADVCYAACNFTIEQHQLLARAIKQRFKAHGLKTQLWGNDWNLNDWYSQKSVSGLGTINDATEDNHYRVFLDSDVATREEMLATYDAVAVHPYDGGATRIPTQVSPYIENLKIHNTETNGTAGADMVSWFNNGVNTYCVWTSFTDQTGGTHYWYENASKVNTVYDNDPGPRASWTNKAATINLNQNPPTFAVTDNCWKWSQFSKYLVAGSDRPGEVGAKRIGCSLSGNSNVTGVAFKNPDGENVLILNNSSSSASRTVRVTVDGRYFTQTLPASSMSTFRWYPDGLTVTSTDGLSTYSNGGTSYVASDLILRVAGTYDDVFYSFTSGEWTNVYYNDIAGAPNGSYFPGNQDPAVNGGFVTGIGLPSASGGGLALGSNSRINVTLHGNGGRSTLMISTYSDGVLKDVYSHTFISVYSTSVIGNQNDVTFYFDNNSREAFAAIFILAAYDAQGKLIAVTAPADSGSVAAANGYVSYSIAKNADTAYYKAFVWEANTFVPLFPAVTVNAADIG